MKKVLLFLPLIFLLAGCKNKDKDVLFQQPFRGLEFTIPAGINPFEAQYFNIDSVPTNALALFSSFGIEASEIQSIVPATARINSLFGNVDYDFILELSVNICPAGDKTPNCGFEAFWRDPVPEAIGSFVDMAANNTDLQELLKQDMVNVQVKLARLRGTSPQFVESILEMDFDVR